MDCSFRRHKGPWHKAKPIMEVKIGDLVVLTVVDTRCTHTMLRADLANLEMGKTMTPVNMVCIHGASYTYQRKRMRLTILIQTVEIAVGLAESLSCPILLGTDWPHLKVVVTKVMGEFSA